MSDQKSLDIKVLGDSAIIIKLGEGIHPSIHQQVKNLSFLLDEYPFDGFIESVPAYNSLAVYYSPYLVYQSKNGFQIDGTPIEKVTDYMNTLAVQISELPVTEGRLVEIPVLYGGEFGPDLHIVAETHGMSIEEVIKIHTTPEYLVYMIGFAPGFPFLGGLDERIATPRKLTPRTSIPPGSVGIAGKQTGVYPLETPGGWQIIGRTPTDLFVPDMSPPSLLQSGDKIKFCPMTQEQYDKQKKVTTCQ
ncbi:kinase inhibitor [Sporosarcina sp. P12(2017)]|uniref:5-oxoprolinase subunit PxpB n=1 Tax=unclassified Sporosarcina TaxID=2647733 RepID=UPI000C1631C7|nr:MULTISPECIES: 5-oxoprolinase subunit PxpB [unclassified Sporosarcina]PIC56280.1 kinase inhibitor [Sporosarcina sp. P10]PIC59524.1 kinase inhibitor [Sporosarcina sp. P12(2017)]